jgi:glycosyltransferase involved in cell wall biosynthesis
MAEKKKIIIIGPAYPYRGGNSLFVSHVYDKLKDNFNVKVYNYKLLYPSLLFPGTTQYDKSNETVKRAPNERIVNSINPFNWISTAYKIIKENADLVVFDWWHPFFSFCHFSVSSIIKKKYKNKILFITENVVSHEGKFYERILTKLGLSNASSFLTLSKGVEKELSTVTRKNIYTSELPVYNCYDNNTSADFKQQLGYSGSDKVILFFGYVRKYKGLDLLLEAFPDVLKSIPEAKLLVVGEFYDSPGIYLELINKLGLKDKVQLINQFVPNEQVEKYYKAADVVVLPYRSATQSGILNVAYGFGIPVVVTNVGGLAEFVEDSKTGVIVPEPSSEKIGAGILKFFSLLNEVNFNNNILSSVKKNKFEELPLLFEEIIKDTLK